MLTLENLVPEAAYCVMRDSTHHESILATGRKIRHLVANRRTSDFQPYQVGARPPPGGYVMVRIGPDLALAVWKDPTRRELWAGQEEPDPVAAPLVAAPGADPVRPAPEPAPATRLQGWLSAAVKAGSVAVNDLIAGGYAEPVAINDQ